MIEQLLESNKILVYAPDEYRFIPLIIFLLLNIYAALSFDPYSAISQTLNTAFKISTNKIVASFIFFLLGRIVFAAWSGEILQKLGLKKGLFISLNMFCVGCVLRTWIEGTFVFVILAQFVIGGAGAIVYSAQFKFLYNWIHPNKRGFVSTLIVLETCLGVVVGFNYILIFVDNKETDIGVIKEGLSNFGYFNLIIAMALLIFHILLFMSKPRDEFGYIHIDINQATKNDVSNIETRNKIEVPQSFKKQLISLFSQQTFVLNLTTYSCCMTLNILLFDSMVAIFSELNLYKPQSVMCVINVFSIGTLGSFYFFRKIMNRDDSKKVFFYFMLSGFILMTMVFFCVIFHAPFVLFFCLIIAFGFCFFMGIPVTIETSMREVQTVPLNIVNSFMFFVSQVFGFGILLVKKLLYNWLDGLHILPLYSTFVLQFVIYIPLLITTHYARQEKKQKS